MTQFLRKVIKIPAICSPNVSRALEQIQRGEEPDGEMVVPGVLSWSEYQRRLATWDEVRVCVGIRAEFWEGASALLYPPAWLDRSHRADLVHLCRSHPATAIGQDSGEGSSDTAMAAVNQWGLKELVWKKTLDTSVIPADVIAFMRRHNVRPEMVCMDRGGGGQQHAHRLRSMGHNVRVVGFGEAVTLEPRRGSQPFNERVAVREDRATYRNRRGEMYGLLREMLDPGRDAAALGLGKVPIEAFAIPEEYAELRRQLAPIPLLYDQEGILVLPPKNRRPGMSATSEARPTGSMKSLVEILGASPDHADALALAVWSLLNPPRRQMAGVFA